MKKGIIGLTCALTAATCFLFACNEPKDISDVKWSNAGITAETLTLPELEVASVKNKSASGDAGISIVWNGATEEEYDALALECYTKIPANKNLFDESSELDGLKSEQSYCNSFVATYVVSDDQYTCSVIYYKADSGDYKAEQLLLDIEKANVNSISVEMWDGVENEDKNWFTADELALMGLDGLAAPQGDIMGKISEEGFYMLAIENTTKAEFETFVEKVFEEYIKVTDEEKFEGKHYNDEIYYSVNESNASVGFYIFYNAGGNTVSLGVTYKSAHIVIDVTI